MKINNYDTFTIAKLAKESMIKFEDTINGTIGSFIYNDNIFRGFKTIKFVSSQLLDEEIYSYLPIDGGEEIKKNITTWLPIDTINNNKDNVKMLVTPGGTGALTLSLASNLKKGDYVLVPKIRWEPYIGIIKNLGMKVHEYNYLDNDKFDLNNLKEQIDIVIKKQNRIALILNDPCNNPTGYSLSFEELNSLVDLLNSYENIKCTLVYDIAYLDYAMENHFDIRERFSIFSRLNNNNILSICFSASKSFCMYGLRCGMAIMIAKDIAVLNDIYDSGYYFCRSTWSNCNKASVNILNNIFKNDELLNNILDEIEEARKELIERANLFIKEAKEVNLSIYDYKGGFFIAIKVDDAVVAMNKLINKHMFFVPFGKNIIRVAICSIPYEKIIGLSKNIKEAL